MGAVEILKVGAEGKEGSGRDERGGEWAKGKGREGRGGREGGRSCVEWCLDGWEERRGTHGVCVYFI